MILLDTNAMLRFGTGDTSTDVAAVAIAAAIRDDMLLVSPISAWEIATLVRRGRLILNRDVAAWWEAFLTGTGARLAPLSASICRGAGALPWDHGNPADRLLVATAQNIGATLVTRDRIILAYAAIGGFAALPF